MANEEDILTTIKGLPDAALSRAIGYLELLHHGWMTCETELQRRLDGFNEGIATDADALLSEIFSRQLRADLALANRRVFMLSLALEAAHRRRTDVGA